MTELRLLVVLQRLEQWLWFSFLSLTKGVCLIMLTKKDFLSARGNFPIKEVEIKELNGSVILRGLSAKEKDQFEQEVFQAKEKGKGIVENFRAKYLVKSIVNEKGEQIFDENDIGWLGDLDGNLIDSLFQEAQKLSGYSSDQLEEKTKN